MTRLRHARLLPVLIGAMGLLLVAKLGGAGLAMVELAAGGRVDLIASAQAEAPPRPTLPQPATPASAPPSPAPPSPARPAVAVASTPAAPPPDAACQLPRTEAAERALLEQLRARRGEIERREQSTAEREVVLAAAERRLADRVEELAALQARVEAAEQARTEREESGWRQMVKLYEGMRPRDAATIFDDLDPPVLLQILARMGERKAAPVLAAMRPERARQITTELARHRAQPPTN